MQIRAGQQEAFERWVQINSRDPYSRAVVNFATAWVQLMEDQLAQDIPLEQMWKDCSFKAAEAHGLTFAMYGAAAAGVAKYWAHGEALRRLHNAEYNKQADPAAPGTVNPAVVARGG